ncbi:type II secretion system protein [bacterium]|nr:type II secretion system protein [bacterium]
MLEYEIIKEINGGFMITGEQKASKYGFTLAEVLITLGIIGIVAAMTMPALIAKYQQKAMVTQLKKVYTELSQAIMMLKADENITDFSESSLNSAGAFDGFIKKYFKVIKECDSITSPCFSNSYKKISGISSLYNRGCGNSKSYILASGATICARFNTSINPIAEIHVDVNGIKNPNVFGKDAFNLFLYTNGIIDDLVVGYRDENDQENTVYWVSTNAPLSAEQREESFQSGCAKGSYGRFYHGCFGKILNDNWEIKY